MFGSNVEESEKTVNGEQVVGNRMTYPGKTAALPIYIEHYILVTCFSRT